MTEKPKKPTKDTKNTEKTEVTNVITFPVDNEVELPCDVEPSDNTTMGEPSEEEIDKLMPERMEITALNGILYLAENGETERIERIGLTINTLLAVGRSISRKPEETK